MDSNVLFVDGLEYNLNSISKLCDKAISILLEPTIYSIVNRKIDTTVFTGKWHDNIYIINFNNVHSNGIKCSVAVGEDTDIWSRRLRHASMMEKLSKKELVWDLKATTFKSTKVWSVYRKYIQ